jgi:hypothetical protein
MTHSWRVVQAVAFSAGGDGAITLCEPSGVTARAENSRPGRLVFHAAAISPQEGLCGLARGIGSNYRQVIGATVGSKRLGRRHVALVGPPKAMQFYELPGVVRPTL